MHYACTTLADGHSVQRGAEEVKSGFAGFGGDGLLRLLVGMLHQLGRQLVEERGGMAGHEAAVFLPPAAMADRERLHGAGDGDVEQAPLLVERALRLRARVRQQAVLHADNIHVGKLQPFATVHRDERHGVARLLVLFFLAFVIQGDLFQEGLQAVERRLRRRRRSRPAWR